MRSRLVVAIVLVVVGVACSPPQRAVTTTPGPTPKITHFAIKELELPKVSIMSVVPSHGRVGSVVTVSGVGCGYDGQKAYIYFFRGSPHGTSGSDHTGLGSVPTDAKGRFSVRYKIPARFADGSLNGSGGGPVYPGTYEFGSRPPVCQTGFQVTG